MKALHNFLKFIIIFNLSIIVLTNLYMMYYQVFLCDNYPTLFGFGRYIAVNDDSKKNINKNDVIITQGFESYNVNDTIIYVDLKKDAHIGTVSKVESDGRYYLNDNSDSVIVDASIKGKMVYTFKGAGPCVFWTESPLGTIAIFMFIVLIIEIPHIIDIAEQHKSESNNKRY